MKNLFKKEINEETYYQIRKKRKWLKTRGFLLAAFVFGVNIYAWFIFIANANLDIEGSVVAWDVNFFDENTEVKDVVIKEILYPGMQEYKKQISIVNHSDTAASFEFDIDSFNILGMDSKESMTKDEVLNSMKNDYPFVIEFNADKNYIGVGESMTFTITMNWNFEEATKYYNITKHYSYDPSVNYYNLNNGMYSIDNTVTSTNFADKRLNLYLEKDDADSFFGEACANFEAATGGACLKYNLKLKVKQVV